MWDLFLNQECDTLGKCFVLSGEDGWGTHNFLRQLFSSPWGQDILQGKLTNEYSCERFMYEGLLRELRKKEGKVYTPAVLWFAGYLYRYIFATRPDATFTEVFYKAHVKILEKRYGFYCTQGWEYIVQDLAIE